MEAWLEGWRAPAQVAVSVSAAAAAPKLKLASTTVTMYADQDYMQLQLLSGDKKLSFNELNVTNLRVAEDNDIARMTEKDRKTYAASAAYFVTKNSFKPATGAFRLEAVDVPVSGKVMLIATIGGVESRR